ncbi:hypothetical protein PP175_25450 (plasmid) [Aneurinibacillus sp. Ricciae_BoGa-3]|uniref:hypothetical protein n=1 Tax=Aneurinibacillus sp. Ricciae_BoGa-3 TaxID=3022697 RepID=UPI0023400A3E|nr:hypothetical protein [Aneurinibacillus sp. Ricciae_BoGa-3]WCK57416.1 hypothetical protein PP175_25450 [Aneurinibacillus sp. Ricciae_BoGa-3]
MIEKLKNGNTLITLGEGTVFTGNVSADESEKPFGIYFSDKESKSENAVIIALPSNKAIASYIMTLVRFLDAYVDENTDQIMLKALEGLKGNLEPMLPTKKAD